MADPGGLIGPPPINRSAQGYLDFLGIKNGGKLPQWQLEGISQVLDLADFYFESQAVLQNKTPTAVTTSPGRDIQIDIVPAGQTWLLKMISAEIQTGAGAGGTFALGINYPSGFMPCLLTPPVTIAASQFGVLVRADNRTLVLPPGTEISGYQISTAGGAFAVAPTWNATYRAAKLFS